MSTPRIILDLIDVFRRNREQYRSPDYNETQCRLEFINPFFEALGWDVTNRRGYDLDYRDVIHEDAVKVAGATKAPDYSFGFGKRDRKFFLEAKKPAVNLHKDPEPAFQLRRYAWSAKMPLAILTDFEEFAIYHCRTRPSQQDKAGVDRIEYFTCEEYPEKWDFIAGIFSPDAIRQGSFDKYAESSRAKRGTAEVDVAFLEEIEHWRDLLARNIALRNEKLTQRELNFAVQRTIDRIIFLRMCEDRGVEPLGQLQGLVNAPDIYKRLLYFYRLADDRYNSGLFHFHAEKERTESPDELTPTLGMDDKVLKEILEGLYYPKSPYVFSCMPPEILGQVYEQFLGKVIRLTAGHRAVVEDKPEVKKAGGVYYTPAYIVDYIVKNTVGRLLGAEPNPPTPFPKREGGEESGSPPRFGEGSGEGFSSSPLSASGRGVGGEGLLTPKHAAKLRILDPACGSGSFLVRAYQYLLDWHRDWYVQQLGEPGGVSPRSAPKELYQGKGGQWLLSTREKKRILVNNIYGVDIDAQAVEVTKLSLLLKVLEHESQETLGRQLLIAGGERALPDLGRNIKCGNSLIGPDFYDGQQASFLDDDEKYRINVFDWHAEFPQIMKQGGFDAVIGNPPYIRMEEFKELKDYLRSRYVSHDERTDIYVYFLERAAKLLRPGGCLGMIVSNKFLRANYGAKLRSFLASECRVNRIVDLAGLPVFPSATVRTIVITALNSKAQFQPTYSPPPSKDEFLALEMGRKDLDEIAVPIEYKLPADALSTSTWTLARPEVVQLLATLRQAATPLEKVADGRICMGIKSGLTEAFVISGAERRRIISHNARAKAIIKPFLQGRDIRRFTIEPRGEYLIYTHHGIDMKPYPAVLEHLRPFKSRLESRATDQAWYELQQPQFAYVEFFEKPKIIFPDIATSCRFAVDNDGFFGANTVYFLPTADLYLLGLLNSRVGQFYFVQTCAALEGPGEAYLRFFGQYLEDFPIRPIDFTSPADKSRHDQLVALVEQMLDLHRQLAAAKTPDERTRLQRQIAATDQHIDRLVYELYELTEEEIKIVEGEAKP